MIFCPRLLIACALSFGPLAFAAAPQEHPLAYDRLRCEPDRAQDFVIHGFAGYSEDKPFTFALVEGPRHGSLTALPTAPQPRGEYGVTEVWVTYTPAAGYRGQDQFTYTVSDGESVESFAALILVENPGAAGVVAQRVTLTRGQVLSTYFTEFYQGDVPFADVELVPAALAGLVKWSTPDVAGSYMLEIDSRVTPENLTGPTTYTAQVLATTEDGNSVRPAILEITILPNVAPTTPGLRFVRPVVKSWTTPTNPVWVATLNQRRVPSHGMRKAAVISVTPATDADGDPVEHFFGWSLYRAVRVQAGENEVMIPDGPWESEAKVFASDGVAISEATVKLSTLSFDQGVQRIISDLAKKPMKATTRLRLIAQLKTLRTVAANPNLATTSLNNRVYAAKLKALAAVQKQIATMKAAVPQLKDKALETYLCDTLDALAASAKE